MASNHLSNTFTCTTTRTYLVSVPQSNISLCVFLFVQLLPSFSRPSVLPSIMHGWKSREKRTRITCDPLAFLSSSSSSRRHVALLSQSFSALSLSSPLSGSIRSTSSSWPHCVVAVSLFNLSFSLPLQLAFSFYPSLTPFSCLHSVRWPFCYPPNPSLLASLSIQVKKLLFFLSLLRKLPFWYCLRESIALLCCWVLKNVASVCSNTL